VSRLPMLPSSHVPTRSSPVAAEAFFSSPETRAEVGELMPPYTRSAKVSGARRRTSAQGRGDGEASGGAVDVRERPRSSIKGMGFFAFRRSKGHPPHRCSCADRAPGAL
jgi:hypothetical protein